VLTAASALVGASIPLAMAENLKDRKHAVKQDLSNANEALEVSSARVRRAAAALLSAQAELVGAQQKLATTQGLLVEAQALDLKMAQELAAAKVLLDEARVELAEGQAHVAEQEAMLANVAVEHYQGGDPSLIGLTMVFSGSEPSDLTSQLQSMQTVMDKEQVMYDELEAARILLQLKEDAVELAKLQVAEQRRQAARNLVRMQALEAQARAEAASVAQLVAVSQDARQAAMKAKGDALDEINRLERERRRIEQLIAAQASHGSGYQGGWGNGFLDLPVDGPITSPYGWRTHPIYGYRSLHDGIDIAANCGVPVRAAAAGKVLEEYYQEAWGNRLIMDHGVHYGAGVATIYNHFSGYAVSVGDTVKRGDIIGYIGTTGWSTGCHLHWTVLENGQAVDPMKWL
jgi:murein DD-endopeptidase MepM/ murein hydrolase activator NlpD